MFNFDRVLIDPKPKALKEALAEAAAAGNTGFRTHVLNWPPRDLASFLIGLRSAAEGHRHWNASRSEAALAIAWWSDPFGRKHCRIVAA